MQRLRTRQPLVQSSDYAVRLKRRFLLIHVIGGLVLSWVLVVISLLSDDTSTALPLIVIISNIVGFTALSLLRNEQLVNIAVWVVIAGLVAISYITPSEPVQIACIAMVVLAASFTIESVMMYSGIVVLAVLPVTIETLGLIQDQANADDIVFSLSVVTFLAIIGVTARYFSNTMSSLIVRNYRNTDLLQATAEIGQLTAKILDFDELLLRSVELIRDRFAYYHVQIFLIDDERKFANLVSSTGKIGEQLLTKGHRLAVGSQSVIGRVTQIGEPVIALDTDRDVVHSHNELLPSTRSEMALPILDGDRIIGALDVQSTRSNAFRSADIQALQVMSNQLGTAIRNAQLFAAQEASVRENKRLFLESEANLREIQRLNRQMTQRVWDDFLEENEDLTGVTLDSQELKIGADWTDTMIEAGQRRRPIQGETVEDPVTVPIVLRGQVIGAIEIQPGEEVPSNEGMVELVQSVAQRLGVSLDNARLFEETQQSAAIEQRVNSVVSRYQSAGSVDDLLQITLSELHDFFGTTSGSIRLVRPDASGQQSDQPAASQNGHRNGNHQNEEQI